MNARKAFTVLVAVSAIAVLAAAFTAEARLHGPNMGKDGMGSGLPALRGLLDLKLSVAQQEAMTRIIDKYRDRQKGLRRSMMAAGRNLREVLQAEPFNEEEARNAFREASAEREEMFVSRAKMMTEMKAILTPEQIALLKERREMRTDRIKKHLGTPPEEKSK